MARLGAGDAYKYLTGSVACHDTERDATTPLVDYYAQTGNPEGYWLGSGLDGLAAGDGIDAGSSVSEDQMQRLYGEGLDPVTGENIGRAYPQYAPLKDRVTERMTEHAHVKDPDVRAELLDKITRQERAKSGHAVAGFDFVFSPPKSVSAAWAIADETTRETIYAAHRQTLTDMIEHIEKHSVYSRVGKGGVAQIKTRGAIVSAFDHWDSRSNDPHLHTHAVFANKVQGEDGKWRTLDSQALYADLVAHSELHQNMLADEITRRLGVGWDTHDRGENRQPGFEISHVPQELLTAFSTRSEQIKVNLDGLVDDFLERHGRSPSGDEWLTLRQQATLFERPRKQEHHSLNSLRDQWIATAERTMGMPVEQIMADIMANQPTARALSAADVGSEHIAAFAHATHDQLTLSKSTWTRANIRAEVSRRTRELRMATITDRVELLEHITEATVALSIPLQAPDLIDPPASLTRSDGRTVFTREDQERFSSHAVLGAEQSLLDTAELPLTDDVAIDRATVKAVTAQLNLSTDQAHAVEHLATGHATLGVLVGPAGSGKTTTLKGLARTWEATHGAGSVIAMAPSAVAAEIMGDELSLTAHTQAKWLHETQGPGAQKRRANITKFKTALQSKKLTPAGRKKLTLVVASLQETDRQFTMRPGQLVLVDEAAMADTMSLAQVAEQARTVGAKLVFIGDPQQLDSPGAGGAMKLLVNDGYSVELTELHRFENRWEAEATRLLRNRDTDVIETYERHGRIHSGEPEAVVDQVYAAWSADRSTGKDSVMIAPTNHLTNDLNLRAQQDGLEAGRLHTAIGRTTHGDRIHIGDTLVTRKNERQVVDSAGNWVKNGNRWIVTGSNGHNVTAHRIDNPGVTVMFTPKLLAESVELGYAATINRAQGLTADTTHTIATAHMDAGGLYVGMSRGRQSNDVYVAIGQAEDDPHHYQELPEPRDVLESILKRDTSQLSATETLRKEYEKLSSLTDLNNKRDYLLDADDALSWKHRLPAVPGMDPASARRIVADPHFDRLAATLRASELAGLNSSDVLRRGVTELGERISASELTVYAAREIRSLGQLPEPGARVLPHDPALNASVQRIDALREQARTTLVDQALAHPPQWIQGIRKPGRDEQQTYRHLLGDIQEHRARYSVKAQHTPLGEAPAKATAELADYKKLARLITRWNTPSTPPTRSTMGNDRSQSNNIGRDL